MWCNALGLQGERAKLRSIISDTNNPPCCTKNVVEVPMSTGCITAREGLLLALCGDRLPKVPLYASEKLRQNCSMTLGQANLAA